MDDLIGLATGGLLSDSTGSGSGAPTTVYVPRPTASFTAKLAAQPAFTARLSK